MSQTAFALREDWQGEVEVELEDGSKETRPFFGGGVLSVGGATVDVGELLEQTGGTIVVESSQQVLVDTLDAYDPLKRVPVPDGAKVVSLYQTWPRALLLEEAQRRDLKGYSSLSSPRLVAALQRQDAERTDRSLLTPARETQPEDLQADADARELAADAEQEGELPLDPANETGKPAGKEKKS